MSIESPEQSPERVFVAGETVKVKRSSGDIEDGWNFGFETPGGKAYVTKEVPGQRAPMSKTVLMKELLEWNS